MKLERILPFARSLLANCIQSGDIAVDATMGNGHDTLFLAKLVGDSGKVFSFDIQQDALIATEKKVAENNLKDSVFLSLCGHEQIKSVIPPSFHGKVTGAVFNLGYLPGGDKSIVTTSATTIEAIKQLLEILAPEGIIVLVIYHGHPEGQQERDALLQYVESIDQQTAHVLEYRFINQMNNPPFIIAIEKR
ncbi:class I SAM-dependent methyltransferase [Niallia sp. NCCP-28]|uniref:tRNA (mnm(5)s(2)U34)-methyltransferase n=1 Tax=Niallia sp. NCCP-28 TaxID=2934712 RepID=UPI002089F005|nr:class I SAM-dependent methyltransferase [Niallia sp. NCCP-28]GKU84812.1 rRNA methyltransferase [Niallia sp. NCCP-28]